MATVITKIYWKNSCLYFDISSDRVPQISILNTKNRETFSFIVEHISEDMYTARLSIAALPGRRTLPEGEYSIVNAEDLIPAYCSPKALSDILSLSRIFRYNDGRYSLNCSFKCDGNDDFEYVYASLLSEYMRQNKNPYRRRPFTEGGTFKQKIAKTVIAIAGPIISLFYNTLHKLSFSAKKSILFFTENRPAPSANHVAILNRMKERGLDKDYRISTFSVNVFELSGKQKLFHWFKTARILAKNKYIFVDDYTPILNHIKIPKDVIITQTWHAGFGFKLVGYGRFGYPGTPHAIYSSHRKYTYGLSCCESMTEIFSEVWGIEQKDIIATGLPRLSNFLNEDYIKETKSRLYDLVPQLKDKKYFIFAPTYRGTLQNEAYYDYNKVDFDALYKLCCEENITCVFKMHHFIKTPVPIPEEYKDRLMEVSGIDINDLYYDAEFLITDYSSCFFDFVILDKPVLFYVYDKDIYCATRGVHRPLEEVAPGKLCFTFNELLSAIKNKDFEQEKIEGFFIDKCKERGKSACDIAIDRIIYGKSE